MSEELIYLNNKLGFYILVKIVNLLNIDEDVFD